MSMHERRIKMRSFLGLVSIVILGLSAPVAHANEASASLQVRVTVSAPTTSMIVESDGNHVVTCPEGVCPHTEVSQVRLADGTYATLLTIDY